MQTKTRLSAYIIFQDFCRHKQSFVMADSSVIHSVQCLAIDGPFRRQLMSRDGMIA